MAIFRWNARSKAVQPHPWLNSSQAPRAAMLLAPLVRDKVSLIEAIRRQFHAIVARVLRIKAQMETR